MDCTNTDIFSPIRNFDDEKNKRQSDGFSEFLKGPVSFKKKSAKSEISENANKNMPAINISSPKSRKTLQKKTSKFEIFSPLHNSEEKTDRPSDGLSEFLKGPDGFKKKSVMSEILENVNENIPVSTISRQKSSKTHQKKTSKSDIFSPIRNFDEKIERQSDGFSEFLKGPDSFKKKSKSDILKNADENILVDVVSSQNSSKILQKKASKCETGKSEEVLASLHNSVAYAEKIHSSRKDKSENVSVTSKGNEKSRKIQQTKVESSNMKKSDPQSSKKDASNLAKSSLPSGAAAASASSGSKERKKAVLKTPSESEASKKSIVKTVSESKANKKVVVASSATQRNPLPQMQSGALEKIINDAVESQVDSIRQSLWSHHLNTLKAINNIQDEMEQRRAENTTMFKVIEELLEENRLLRNAVLARQ